jgi:hypothetical protein
MKSLICFTLLLPLTAPSFAQRKRAGTSYQPMTLQFNQALEKLPSLYKGHNIVAVYDALIGSRPEKSEFETTERFEKRLSAHRAMFEGRVYAFRMEDTDGLHFTSPKYNADTQTLSVNITSRTSAFMIGQLIHLKNEYQTRTSIGQNAFGTKVRITTLSGYEYYLACLNGVPATVDLPLGSSIAQRIKPQVDVLFVCRIKANSVGKLIGGDFDTKEATFSSPYAKDIKQLRVYFELLSIWVYNKATGEILKKQSTAQKS